MKHYLERQIARGEKLTVMQDRINKAAASGMITMEDKEALDTKLLANANAGDNAPDIRDMVVALAARVKALEEQMAEAPAEPEDPETPDEPDAPVEPDTPVEPEETVYPEWKPWDGISKDYTHGAIVSHNGKLWESVHIGQNTWEPGTIGTERLWKEYVKPDTTEEEVNE